jgi:hypothetical protein
MPRRSCHVTSSRPIAARALRENRCGAPLPIDPVPGQSFQFVETHAGIERKSHGKANVLWEDFHQPPSLLRSEVDLPLGRLILHHLFPTDDLNGFFPHLCSIVHGRAQPAEAAVNDHWTSFLPLGILNEGVIVLVAEIANLFRAAD